jgi:hypothetical protein
MEYLLTLTPKMTPNPANIPYMLMWDIYVYIILYIHMVINKNNTLIYGSRQNVATYIHNTHG